MHHPEDRVGREARRVLAEGGWAMLVDYGPPRGGLREDGGGGHQAI